MNFGAPEALHGLALLWLAVSFAVAGWQAKSSTPVFSREAERAKRRNPDVVIALISVNIPPIQLEPLKVSYNYLPLLR